MARVTMVFGEIGAGKTTYARALEAAGAIRLSLDEWTIAATGDPVHVTAEVVQRITDQLMEHWPPLVTAGVDVVLDFGFWERAHRDAVRTRAVALGAETHLVHVRCDLGQRRRRVQQRPHDDTTYTIDADGFDWITANRRIDPLGDDEPHTIIDTTDR